MQVIQTSELTGSYPQHQHPAGHNSLSWSQPPNDFSQPVGYGPLWEIEEVYVLQLVNQKDIPNKAQDKTRAQLLRELCEAKSENSSLLSENSYDNTNNLLAKIYQKLTRKLSTLAERHLQAPSLDAFATQLYTVASTCTNLYLLLLREKPASPPEKLI